MIWWYSYVSLAVNWSLMKLWNRLKPLFVLQVWCTCLSEFAMATTRGLKQWEYRAGLIAKIFSPLPPGWPCPSIQDSGVALKWYDSFREDMETSESQHWVTSQRNILVQKMISVRKLKRKGPQMFPTPLKITSKEKLPATKESCWHLHGLKIPAEYRHEWYKIINLPATTRILKSTWFNWENWSSNALTF